MFKNEFYVNWNLYKNVKLGVSIVRTQAVNNSIVIRKSIDSRKSKSQNKKSNNKLA